MRIQPFSGQNASDVNYWGKHTATLDWCEENYAACKYIAEFYNTTTNLVFVALAFHGMYNIYKQKLEKRFHAAYLSFFTVGVGSWLFHMTLLYEMQLLDELPMIYATCTILYTMLETDERPKYGWKLPIGLAICSAIITASYLYLKDPTFHQVAYGILTITLVTRGGYLYYLLPETRAKRILYRMLQVGWGTYSLGFILWNIDNQFCPQLRQFRNYVGTPFSPLLQLHGWWHVLAGTGCYAAIVANQYIRLILLGKEDGYKVTWSLGILPTVIRDAEKEKVA